MKSSSQGAVKLGAGGESLSPAKSSIKRFYSSTYSKSLQIIQYQSQHTRAKFQGYIHWWRWKFTALKLGYIQTKAFTQITLWVTHVCMCAELLQSCPTFLTLWTVVCQAPLSIGLCRQEYWSGLPRPPPGPLPDWGAEPASLTSLALAGGFFITSATWEAQCFV